MVSNATRSPAKTELHRGSSIVIYWEVFNDDRLAGPRTWMFVDDVSAQVCK
jgi:hypothetical protein